MKIDKYQFSTILFNLVLGGLMLVIAPPSWSQTTDARHKTDAARHAHPSKKPRAKKPKKQLAATQQPTELNENSAPTKIVHTHQLSALDETLNAAYLAFQQADFNGARQRYRQALALDNNSRDAMLGLAVVAQHEGQDAAALHFFEQPGSLILLIRWPMPASLYSPVARAMARKAGSNNYSHKPPARRCISHWAIIMQRNLAGLMRGWRMNMRYRSNPIMPCSI